LIHAETEALISFPDWKCIWNEVC